MKYHSNMTVRAGIATINYVSEKKIRAINHKVASKFANNSSISFLSYNNLMCIDNSLPFYIRHLQIPSDLHNNKADPFAWPIDPMLHIMDLNDQHCLIFNKFTIIKWHSLLITKLFETQHQHLRLIDFKESFYIMTALKGLMFYNSNPDAGASQSHKHIQIVPCNEFPSRLLLDEIDNYGRNLKGANTLPWYNFCHCIYIFDRKLNEEREPSRILNNAYWKCAEKINNLALNAGFNLIATNNWLLMVKRKRDSYKGVKVNALGFIGSFAVKSKDQLKTILNTRPLSLLKELCED